MNRKSYKKKVKNNDRILRLRKLATVSITTGIVIVLIGLTLFISQNFYLLSTISLHSIDNSVVHWNKDWTMNIIVGSLESNNNMLDLKLVMIDKTTVKVLPIPNDLFVPENGTYLQLNTIYALSALQSNVSALNMFERYFHDNLRLHIDAYYFMKTSPNQSYLDVKSYLSQQGGTINDATAFFNAASINHYLNTQVYTNLDKASLYNVAKQIGSVTTVNQVKLSSNDLVHFTQGEYINSSVFQTGTAMQLADVGLQDEHARIAFYNGTGVTGKAELLGQMIQARGGTTDFISSSPTTVSKTVIYCQNPSAFPYTIATLRRMLQSNVNKKAYSLSADITVVLGQDILKDY